MNTRPLKILLVHDSPQVLEKLSSILRGAGYDLLTTQDGLDALRLLESENPHFLLCAWDLPHLSGMDLCRHVRQSSLPHYVYSVILSGQEHIPNMAQALEHGADGFLLLPTEQRELLARIRTGARILEMEHRLVSLANTDSLTGLPTRRMMLQDLKTEFWRAKRQNIPLCCVMLDVDYFKHLNDTHGHATGDVALRIISQVLLDYYPPNGVVYRYGGEEFCALLSKAREAEAVLWAEQVRESIFRLVFPLGDAHVKISASFGVAQISEEMQYPEQLLDSADEALLVAKQLGRNRVVSAGSLDEPLQLMLGGKDGFDPFRDILAAEVMSSPVICLREDEMIGQAAEVFCRYRINSAPVVDEEGKLVGILSEKDLLITLLSPDIWRTPVSQLMKTNVISYEEETPVRLIYDFLCRVSIRRIVIVRDRRPTGTVSRSSLLRWYHNWIQSTGFLKASEDPGVQSEYFRAKQQVLDTLNQLEGNVQRLRGEVHADSEHILPSMIATATHIQDLVDELMISARTAFNPLPNNLSHFPFF